jgi:unsaturated rhamnogalacturonyl hydrolase
MTTMATALRFFSTVIVLLVACAASFAQTEAPTSQPADASAEIGRGKAVGLDLFFNHQMKDGVQFHYIWDDTKNSGYSKFGKVWEQYGATLGTLAKAPTRQDLDQFSVYIIVNPSTEKNAADNAPNYIDPGSIDAIAGWVNDGGVLALFANDKNNCEFEHLNQLAQRFGIKFNGDLRNAVPTRKDMARGTFSEFPDHPLFKDVKMIYMKEISTLTAQDPAQPLLTADKQDDGQGKDIIMATAHFGKGFVFAVGDPWVYNEYIDVKTPTLPIENHKAAQNLVRWLLGIASTPGKPGPTTVP